MGSVVLNNADLVSAVLAFSQEDEFWFFGRVNRAFHESYRSRNTMAASCFESVHRLEDSLCKLRAIATTSIEEHVMKCSSSDVMRHALSTGMVTSLNGALEHAIRSNNTNLITCLEKEFQETRVGPACMVAAVQSGSLELVKKYCNDGVLSPEADNFGLIDSYFHPFSMSEKRMICRQWKKYVGDYLTEAAKQGGFFEILKWLHFHNIPHPGELDKASTHYTHDIVGEAAMHGNKDMVEWMLAAGYTMSACEIPYAARSNDVPYLEWLISKGGAIDTNSLDCFTNLDPDVARWLRSKGYVNC